MNDQFDEFGDDNLMDEDDALDFILYKEMQENEKQRAKGGCLSMVVILLIPVGILLAL